MSNPASSVRPFLSYVLGERRRTTIVTSSLLLFASIAEATGVLALFPVVMRLLQPDSQSTSPFVGGVEQSLRLVGIEPTLTNLFAIVISGVFLKGLLTWLAMRKVGYVVADMATDLRVALVTALFRARWDLFVRERLGRFASAVGYEAGAAANAYQKACETISRIIQVGTYTLIVFIVSWRLALMTLLLVAVVIYLMGRFVRAAHQAGRSHTDSFKAFISKLLDTVHGIKTIRAMGADAYFLEQIRADATEVNTALRRQTDASEALQAAQEPLFVVAIVLGLLFATRVLDETPTVVAMLGFVLFRVSIQLRLALSQYQQMISLLPMYASARRAIEQAGEHEEQALGSATPPALEDCLRVNNLSFAYERTTLLDNVNLEIPARSMTVIIGQSGVGKSTLLDLLMAIQRPTRGEILVDGTPLSSLSLLEWRRRIGYVPQDANLIHESVFANVALGDERLTETDVREALEAAGALGFVDELEEGLHTKVGEHGSRLSAGQRQRVALARALVRRPALLILDEVTANLDAATARDVVRTLASLRHRTTVVAVTHQPELLDAADRVYQLADGHAELVRTSEPVCAA